MSACVGLPEYPTNKVEMKDQEVEMMDCMQTLDKEVKETQEVSRSGSKGEKKREEEKDKRVSNAQAAAIWRNMGLQFKQGELSISKGFKSSKTKSQAKKQLNGVKREGGISKLKQTKLRTPEPNPDKEEESPRDLEAGRAEDGAWGHKRS